LISPSTIVSGQYGRCIFSYQGKQSWQRVEEETTRKVLHLADQLPLSQTLIVPAVISLIIFLLTTYVLLPLWTRYRQRYSQYIPLDRISNQTQGIRHRVQGYIAQWMVPSAWRRDQHVTIADADSDDGFESDDGEELAFVPTDQRRAISVSEQHRPDDTRRLSRE
jgi:hypothetical protein